MEDCGAGHGGKNLLFNWKNSIYSTTTLTPLHFQPIVSHHLAIGKFQHLSSHTSEIFPLSGLGLQHSGCPSAWCLGSPPWSFSLPSSSHPSADYRTFSPILKRHVGDVANPAFTSPRRDNFLGQPRRNSPLPLVTITSFYLPAILPLPKQLP